MANGSIMTQALHYSSHTGYCTDTDNTVHHTEHIVAFKLDHSFAANCILLNLAARRTEHVLLVVRAEDAGQSHLFCPSITNSRRVYSALCRSCRIPPGQGFLALYSKMSSGKPEMMSCTIWWGSSLRWFWLVMITVSACKQASQVYCYICRIQCHLSHAPGIQMGRQVKTSEKSKSYVESCSHQMLQ